MATEEIVSYISNVGFPIVMCGAMGWFIQTQFKTFEQVLDGNTQVLTKLYEKICEKE